MSDIKPIETLYDGYRFRSRLEARWAVYFKTLGIAYEYEKEGYDLGEAGWYLPDFWLPQVNMWAEVKADKFNQFEMAKVHALIKHTGYDLLMLVGTPDTIPYWIVSHGTHCHHIVGCNGECAEQYEQPIQYDCSIDTSYLHEHRFFTYLGDDDQAINDDTKKAVQAAKSARFEFGERG